MATVPQKTGSPAAKAIVNKSGAKTVGPKTQFARDFTVAFGKNLGKTGLEIGKSIVKAPIRVGASLAEIPKVVKSGGSKTSDPFKLPLLGEVKTYSREAQDKIKAGDGSKTTTAATILGTGGSAILDTVATGSAAKGIKHLISKAGSKAGATNVAAKTVTPKTTANDVLAKRIENTKAVESARAFPDSIENQLERSSGWIEGTKQLFDTALRAGDKLAVKAFIKAGAVPKAYQQTFAKEIGKVISGVGAYAK